MNNKVIEYLKSSEDTTTVNIIELILMLGLMKELQTSLNLRGNKLAVDGVLGFKTILALESSDAKVLLKDMNNVLSGSTLRMPKENNEAKFESVLMNFLSRWESTKVHYNKDEKSYTTPYGVYRHANPNTDIIRYMDSLYGKYGLNINSRADAKSINSRLLPEERAKIATLAYKLYSEKYSDSRVKSMLSKYRYFKTLLSYVVNSINGGLGRGNRTLQGAIGATVDGGVGPNTLSKLKVAIGRYDDKNLNKGVIREMRDFYYRLANSSAKHRRNLKGWLNRLTALA